MKHNQRDIPLVLFAKAPVPGEVKTRLTQHCSHRQAADIAEILIEETLTKAVNHWPGKVYLSIWQFNQHPFIVDMLNKFDVQLVSQSSGDLGEKMQSTFDQYGYPLAIMGCDAPLVRGQTFKQAYKMLSEQQHVIGPSEDGGYYLIGLSEPASQLFKEINWGTDSVLDETITQALKNNVELNQLSESYDVDRWNDVQRACEEIKPLQDYLTSQKMT